MRFFSGKSHEVKRLEEACRIHNEQYAGLQTGYDKMREARDHFRSEAERLEQILFDIQSTMLGEWHVKVPAWTSDAELHKPCQECPEDLDAASRGLEANPEWSRG